MPLEPLGKDGKPLPTPFNLYPFGVTLHYSGDSPVITVEARKPIPHVISRMFPSKNDYLYVAELEEMFRSVYEAAHSGN